MTKVERLSKASPTLIVPLILFTLFLLLLLASSDLVYSQESNSEFASPSFSEFKNIYIGAIGLPDFPVKKQDVFSPGKPVKRAKAYLSPNREFLAVTVSEGESGSVTHIANLNGDPITKSYKGAFSSWSPDSSKVLVYVASTRSIDGARHIYQVDLEGNYSDFGLPRGAINADISAKDGRVIYAITGESSDNSDLYSRTTDGRTSLLIRGNSNIFSGVRIAPQGNKFAFLRADLGLTRESRGLWLQNVDGTGLKKVSGVDWGYSPVWSPDSGRVLFSNASNIWEYNAASDEMRKVTSFSQGDARYPVYLSDGETIMFNRTNESGEKDVWVAPKDGEPHVSQDSRSLFPVIYEY